MKPAIPEHTITPNGDGTFVVLVGNSRAGTVSEDKEHEGLWFVVDPEGMFMGRARSKEAAAEFLAAWFVAEDAG
ncbi:hypothetical protein LPC10_01605 [Methylorubrum sp. B1-46]|uniref:hypothetical protein n=1 Tax=Methylorubrum sp. B1-46 TaxID=2897334 RepID=UPI001E4173E4|nr:hypothetical protein [Methylorubrum sp. B1-46]UGB26336.1 hypothetical protein LPC10_01605 [Methylorubrum sp. B1-46]